jgi:hypothetical protein
MKVHNHAYRYGGSVVELLMPAHPSMLGSIGRDKIKYLFAA